MRRTPLLGLGICTALACANDGPTQSDESDGGSSSASQHDDGDDDASDASAEAGPEATSDADETTRGDDESEDDGDGPTDDGTGGQPTGACAFEGLRAVADVLADADADCAAWVESVYGRVARSGPGSAVVWTLDTEATTGVLVGARHSLGMGWAPGEAVPARLSDPKTVEGALLLHYPEADTGRAQDGLAPMFEIRVPELPAAESNSLADLRPRHDWYVAAVDDQLYVELKPFPLPDLLHLAPPTIVDPHGTASAQPTYADAQPSTAAIVLGHPADADAMTVAVGEVLDDAEAEAAIAKLQQAGDDEGSIPYDAEAEFVMLAEAAVGMSGGGVFDGDGRLIGIAVRATLAGAPERYVRAVRASFIADELNAALVTTAPELRAAIELHLP